jgi:hypothetical protein
VLDDPSLVEYDMELHHGSNAEESPAAEGRHSADPEQRPAETADDGARSEPAAR